MRIVCAAAGGKPADVRFNVAEILNVLKRARADEAQLIVLPQLCVTGIGCGDLFRSSTLLDAALAAAQEIAEASVGLTCVFGLPLRVGVHLVSAAAVAQDGRVVQFLADLNSPHCRWFSSGLRIGEVVLQGDAVPMYGDVLQIDGHTVAVRFPEETFPPSADVIAVMGGEPFIAGAGDVRARRFATFSGTVAFANASVREATTDHVYGGHLLITGRGMLLAEHKPFTPDAYLVCDTIPAAGTPVPEATPCDPRYPYAPAEGPARERWCRDLTRAAAQSLATRMQNIGVDYLTLGVSGGVDSAHALMVSVEALKLLSLPADHVVAVSLPAFGSTRRTQDNAARLIKSLGLTPRVIPIGDSVAKHLTDIGHDGKTPDAAYENAQARERTQVLMDLANMVGGLMVGSGDLSELALGFTTYGGDHLSMYAVNAGIYKTALRMVLSDYVAAHPGTETAAVLTDILNTPVSPELLPPKDGEMAQRTEDIVGPYDLNDFFTHHFLTDFVSPRELMARAQAAFGGQYNRAQIARRMKGFFQRFFAAQFKRGCACDGPQLLSVSVSPRGGLSMPSDAVSGLWLAECDRLLTKS